MSEYGSSEASYSSRPQSRSGMVLRHASERRRPGRYCEDYDCGDPGRPVFVHPDIPYNPELVKHTAWNTLPLDHPGPSPSRMAYERAQASLANNDSSHVVDEGDMSDVAMAPFAEVHNGQLQGPAVVNLSQQGPVDAQRGESDNDLDKDGDHIDERPLGFKDYVQNVEHLEIQQLLVNKESAEPCFGSLCPSRSWSDLADGVKLLIVRNMTREYTFPGVVSMLNLSFSDIFEFRKLYKDQLAKQDAYEKELRANPCAVPVLHLATDRVHKNEARDGEKFLDNFGMAEYAPSCGVSTYFLEEDAEVLDYSLKLLESARSHGVNHESDELSKNTEEWINGTRPPDTVDPQAHAKLEAEAFEQFMSQPAEGVVGPLRFWERPSHMTNSGSDENNGLDEEEELMVAQEPINIPDKADGQDQWRDSSINYESPPFMRSPLGAQYNISARPRLSPTHKEKDVAMIETAFLPGSVHWPDSGSNLPYNVLGVDPCALQVDSAAYDSSALSGSDSPTQGGQQNVAENTAPSSAQVGSVVGGDNAAPGWSIPVRHPQQVIAGNAAPNIVRADSVATRSSNAPSVTTSARGLKSIARNPTGRAVSTSRRKSGTRSPSTARTASQPPTQQAVCTDAKSTISPMAYRTYEEWRKSPVNAGPSQGGNNDAQPTTMKDTNAAEVEDDQRAREKKETKQVAAEAHEGGDLARKMDDDPFGSDSEFDPSMIPEGDPEDDDYVEEPKIKKTPRKRGQAPGTGTRPGRKRTIDQALDGEDFGAAAPPKKRATQRKKPVSNENPGSALSTIEVAISTRVPVEMTPASSQPTAAGENSAVESQNGQAQVSLYGSYSGDTTKQVSGAIAQRAHMPPPPVSLLPQSSNIRISPYTWAASQQARQVPSVGGQPVVPQNSYPEPESPQTQCTSWVAQLDGLEQRAQTQTSVLDSSSKTADDVVRPVKPVPPARKRKNSIDPKTGKPRRGRPRRPAVTPSDSPGDSPMELLMSQPAHLPIAGNAENVMQTSVPSSKVDGLSYPALPSIRSTGATTGTMPPRPLPSSIPQRDSQSEIPVKCPADAAIPLAGAKMCKTPAEPPKRNPPPPATIVQRRMGHSMSLAKSPSVGFSRFETELGMVDPQLWKTSQEVEGEVGEEAEVNEDAEPKPEDEVDR